MMDKKVASTDIEDFLCSIRIGEGLSPKERVWFAYNELDVALKTDMPEKLQLRVVKHDGTFIRYILNATFKVLLAAVNQNGHALEFIINRELSANEKLKIIKAAFNQNIDCIQYVKGISDENQLKAVTKNAELIKVIEKPCVKVQLFVVNKNVELIKHIKKPCIKAQIAAVTKNAELIKAIEKPCIEAQEIAININWELFKDTSSLSDSVILEFLIEHPQRIGAFGNLSTDVQKRLIDNNYRDYDSIKNKTNDAAKHYKLQHEDAMEDYRDERRYLKKR